MASFMPPRHYNSVQREGTFDYGGYGSNHGRGSQGVSTMKAETLLGHDLMAATIVACKATGPAVPKLLNPDHDQGSASDSDSSPTDNTTILISDPVVKQPDNVVTDDVDVMSQGFNSNPMYIKSCIRNNAQETILFILVDTGARKNLISATTLTSFDKKLPKLKQESIQLCGANGSSLNSLGSITLFTKLGDKEHLLKFHVINDLATTAILGSDDLTRLNACINCSEGHISFNGGVSIPLQPATEPTDVVSNYGVSLSPREHRVVSCWPRTKNNILCRHIVIEASEGLLSL